MYHFEPSLFFPSICVGLLRTALFERIYLETSLYSSINWILNTFELNNLNFASVNKGDIKHILGALWLVLIWTNMKLCILVIWRSLNMTDWYYCTITYVKFLRNKLTYIHFLCNFSFLFVYHDIELMLYIFHNYMCIISLINSD